jgi:hypothetical protein
MVGDARDAPAGSVWPGTRVVDLAHDRVLGPQGRGNCGNRRADGGMPGVTHDRLQRGRRIRHGQLGVLREKLYHIVEPAIVNPACVAVHQI